MKNIRVIYIVVTQLEPELKPLIMNTEFVQDSAWYANIPISDAVRASMSIPLVFRPYQMRVRVNDVAIEKWPRLPRTFVDGGLLINYPLHELDRVYYAENALRAPSQWSLGRQTYINHNTLGLYLNTSSGLTKLLSAPTTIMHLAGRLWDLYYNCEYLSNFRDEDDRPRTVFLPCAEETKIGEGVIDKKKIGTSDFKNVEQSEYKDFAGKWSKRGVQVFLDQSKQSPVNVNHDKYFKK